MNEILRLASLAERCINRGGLYTKCGEKSTSTHNLSLSLSLTHTHTRTHTESLVKDICIIWGIRSRPLANTLQTIGDPMLTVWELIIYGTPVTFNQTQSFFIFIQRKNTVRNPGICSPSVGFQVKISSVPANKWPCGVPYVAYMRHVVWDTVVLHVV